MSGVRVSHKSFKIGGTGHFIPVPVILFCEQVWLYRHVPVALYLRLAPQKLITETATEALALVAILSLQLNECLRVACSVGFDVVLLPRPTDFGTASRPAFGSLHFHDNFTPYNLLQFCTFDFI